MPNDPRTPASGQYSEMVDTFRAAGWRATQWDQVDAFFTQHAASPGADLVTRWLRHPPQRIQSPISPEQVLDLFARYGQETAKMLTVIGAGAPERFVLALLSRNPDLTGPVLLNGWRHAITLGLNEEEAAGWAATGYLGVPYNFRDGEHTDVDRDTINALVGAWTEQFGPGAWLWVLAGFTLEEAVELRDSGTVITSEQLRVMVALHGPTVLPDNT